jgi:hypothetical protein
LIALGFHQWDAHASLAFVNGTSLCIITDLFF